MPATHTKLMMKDYQFAVYPRAGSGGTIGGGEEGLDIRRGSKIGAHMHAHYFSFIGCYEVITFIWLQNDYQFCGTFFGGQKQLAVQLLSSYLTM